MDDQLTQFSENVGTTNSAVVRIMVGRDHDWDGFSALADAQPGSRISLEAVDIPMELADVDVSEVSNQAEYVSQSTGLDLWSLIAARGLWQLFVNPEKNAWGVAVYWPDRLKAVADLMCA